MLLGNNHVHWRFCGFFDGGHEFFWRPAFKVHVEPAAGSWFINWGRCRRWRGGDRGALGSEAGANAQSINYRY